MFNPVQVYSAAENIQGIISSSGSVLTNTLGVAFVLALLVFLWGIAKFILASSNEAAIEEGKRFLFWGVIIMFVATTIWGIVNFLSKTLGV
ncbi:MAG: hypothetical protein MRY49_01675 [Candidatus Pacebacteria bacterium]|nr:hypothetical protein [Candidatus Paceibacterota bacterium]